MATGNLGPRLLDLIFDHRSLELAELSRAFNPFRVLRVETYELRHTNTLAWLLSPTGSHGLGAAFVTQFLKALCAYEDNNNGTGLEMLTAIAQTDLEAIRIRQEVSLAALRGMATSEAEAAIDGTLEEEPADQPGKDDEDENGRLDILVEGETWLVAIEAKVNARQGKGQLPKYKKSLDVGAPKHRQLCAYLTNDVTEDVPTPWDPVSWKAVVARPLREILDRLPPARRTEPQIAFLESFLEILAENGSPPEGRREMLLAQLVHEYAPLLNEFRTRKKSGTLTDSDLELVRRHSDLINILEKRFKPPNLQRLPILETMLANDSRFDLVATSRTYLKFIPKEWRQFPWISMPGKGPTDSGVLCELPNFVDGSVQLKLQIRFLSESDEYQSHRLRLLKLIQNDDRPETRQAFPKVFTKNGLRDPDALYFTIFSTESIKPAIADTESAVIELIDGSFSKSLRLMTEFMAKV